MKKNDEKLLDVIGEVRDDLIPDLAPASQNRGLKITLTAMCGLCAAFALFGVGMKVYSRIHENLPADSGSASSIATTVETTGPSQQSSAKKSFWEGMTPAAFVPEKDGTEQLKLSIRGFNQPIFVDDVEKCAAGPAHSTQIGRSTMPAFRNLGVGQPDRALSSQFLSEEQTKELLLRAAELLEIPVTEINADYWNAEQTFLLSWVMQTEDCLLQAERDGTVTMTLSQPLNGQSLEAFAREQYEPLMGWSGADSYVQTLPGAETWYVKRFDGTETCRLYEASDDRVTELLNDSLASVEVVRDIGTDTVTSVTFRNPLIAAEYIGEYELIPEEEARAYFLNFDLHEAGAQDYPDIADKLEGGRVPQERLKKTELVYLYNEHEDFIAPYYRFWVQTDGLHSEEYVQYTGNQDLSEFTPFDVPAVRDMEAKTIRDDMTQKSVGEKYMGTKQLTWEIGYTGTVLLKDDGLNHLTPSKAGSDGFDQDSLPVFEMLSRAEDPELYLNEEDMKANLERVAGALKLETGPMTSNTLPAGGSRTEETVYSVTMQCRGAKVTVDYDGTVHIVYTLGETLPEDAWDKGTAVSDQGLIDYVKQTYAPLLSWTETEGYVRREYSDDHTEKKTYCFYDNAVQPVQALLNDSLAGMEVTRDGEKNIGTVTINSALFSADYIGDYEKISEQEAKKQLLSIDLRKSLIGQSLASCLDGWTVDGKVNESLVGLTEAIYLRSGSQYMPFYRFWIRTGERDGYAEFIPIDIPAVRAELEQTVSHHGN